MRTRLMGAVFCMYLLQHMDGHAACMCKPGITSTDGHPITYEAQVQKAGDTKVTPTDLL